MATKSKPKSVKALTKELGGLVSKAKNLGKTSPGLEDSIKRSQSMIAQTKREGSRSYIGSKEQKRYVATGGRGGGVEPVVMSTVNGKKNFEYGIQPIINRANQGLANIGIAESNQATVDQGKDPTDPIMQQEYENSQTPEQKASNAYIDSLTRQSEAVTKAYDEMAKASAQKARAQTRQLRQQYEQRKAMQEEANKANYAEWEQQMQRTGTAEYSPGISSDFLSAKEREGFARVQELTDEYMVAVDTVNSALEEKKYSIAAEKAQELQEIEDKIQKQITDNLKEAKAENEKLVKQQEAQKRDKAIISLMQTGTTDPLEIYSQMALDGTLGDTTLSDVLAIASKVESSKPKAKGGSTVTAGSDVNGVNVDTAKIQEVKALARQLFVDISSKIISQLSDEELRDFIYAWNEYQKNPGEFIVDTEDPLYAMKDLSNYGGKPRNTVHYDEATPEIFFNEYLKAIGRNERKQKEEEADANPFL